MEPMLTAQEVAEHLRINVDEVRRMLNRGELRGVNVGRGNMKPRWRIEPAALEQFKQRMTIDRSNQRAPRPRKRVKDYLEIL